MTLASNLTNFNTIDFYTDGSLSNGGTIHIIIGIGWTTAFSNTPNYTFHATLSNNPSSTKTKTIAILTALIMCPANAMVNIFTDSQYCVDHFNRLNHSSFTTTHYKSSSHPNYLQWEIIFELISTLLLQVTLFKILDHSQNYFNDIADNLANTSRHLHILDIYSSQLTNWSCYISWIDNIIEQPLRPFLKHTFQVYTFN